MSARTSFLRLLTGAGHRFAGSRLLALLAAPLLAALLMTAVSAPADASPAPLGSHPAATAQAPAKTQTVTTLTGGRLQLQPGKAGEVVSTGPALSYTALDGDRYLVPAAAAPYAGRELSWSLFDISAMVRDHITNGAKIPVTLSLTSASASPPPGITLTSSAGTSAQGYLTPSSARTFAAFLRRQAAADVVAGKAVGTAPLPGLAGMTLAASAPATAQQVSPQYAYQIVEFKTPGLSGPANALIKLWNMDSVERLSIALNSYNGVARVAVPAGNYYVIGQFTDFDAQGNLTALRYVTTGFTVPDSGAVTTVALKEKSASALSTPTTPLPAVQVNQFLTWGVQDATQGPWNAVTAVDWGPAGSDTQGVAGADIYVAPEKTGLPAGRLHYYIQWDGIAPPSGGSYPYPYETNYPYRYDLAFGWDNQIPTAPYPVEADQLATVRDHVYADPALTPSTFQFSKSPIDPVLPQMAAFSPGDLWTREAPGDFTDYIGTADGGDWLFNTDIGPPNAPAFQDFADPQTFSAGHVYSLNWGQGPLAPEWGQHAPRPAALYQDCGACVTEGAGFNYLNAQYPMDSEDSQQADQALRVQNDTGACYINGTEVATYPDCSDYYTYPAGTTPPSQVNTYRLVMDTGGASWGPAYGQSTPTQTDLVFQFQYKTSPPADMTLPSGYQCAQYPGSGACEILPVLTLNYQMAENELNTSDSPVQLMMLNVGHETYDGFGSHAAITSVSVQVSFDGGTTWQPAVLGGHDGHYVAHWHNPASARGTSPDLMVTATDAIGGSITQTIDNAYTISPTA